jgi:hypothetical protein
VSSSNRSQQTQTFKNQILAALPRSEQERLLPSLERVALQTGQQLSEAGEPLRHVYFPESALISLLSVTDDGTSVEVRLVGSEGMLGIPIFLSSASMPYRATVRIGGAAQRMNSEPLKKEFDRCGPFHDLLLSLYSRLGYSAFPIDGMQPFPYCGTTPLPLAAVGAESH